jgi:hypothetical protein
LALAGIGFLWAGLTWNADTPGLLMAVHMTLSGVGLGLTIAPIGTVVINEVDESQRGVASALVLIMRLIGMTLAVASLTTFALNRLAYLVSVARAAFAPGLSAEEIQHYSLQAYLHSGAQVIAEMLLIGAVVCGLALIPALFLRQGRPRPAETAPVNLGQ